MLQRCKAVDVRVQTHTHTVRHRHKAERRSGANNVGPPPACGSYRGSFPESDFTRDANDWPKFSGGACEDRRG